MNLYDEVLRIVNYHAGQVNQHMTFEEKVLYIYNKNHGIVNMELLRKVFGPYRDILTKYETENRLKRSFQDYTRAAYKKRPFKYKQKEQPKQERPKRTYTIPEAPNNNIIKALGIFNLSLPCKWEDVKKARKVALMIYHPDKLHDQPEKIEKAKELTQSMNLAFDVLKKYFDK